MTKNDLRAAVRDVFTEAVAMSEPTVEEFCSLAEELGLGNMTIGELTRAVTDRRKWAQERRRLDGT